MDKKLTIVKLFFALIVLCFFTQRAFAQATFTTKTDIALTASIGAMYMISADINSDGKPDLITANQNGTGTISILLNTTATNASTPTFSAQTDFITGLATHSVSAGDINGDGLIDLVAVNTTDATASVFLNTTTPGASTPTLGTKVNFATGTNPYSVVLKDMNGDGKLDMVVANQTGNSIGVFINTTATGASTPTFGAMTAFTTLAGPTHLAIADLNGDGLQDVVVPCNTAASVCVFFNTTTIGSATPTFGTRVDLTAGSTVWSVSIGDLNLDGKPDIACANRGAATETYYLNTTTTGSATPSFSAGTNLTIGSTPFGVLIADINNDGKPDILNGARGGAQFSVYMNTTTPGASSLTFLARTDYTTASQPYFPVVADFNGDGKKDVAADCGTGNSISVFLNTTDLSTTAPSFSGNTDFTTATFPYAVATADFNGDGKQDIVTANASHASVSVLMNTTSPGAATPTFTPKVDFPTAINIQSATTGDINNDGKPDIISANGSFSPGIISVLLNVTPPGSTTPLFSANTDFAVGNAAIWVSIGDLNGDGISDIATANLNGNTISVLFNTTTPGSSTPTFTSSVDLPNGLSPYSVQIRDINGDGKQDLISANYDGNSVSVYINTTTPGSLTPSFLAKTDFTTGTHPTCARVRDINGDGKPDLITLNYSANSQSILLNTTTPGALTPTFTAKTDFPSNGNPYSVELGDLNGDGKPDMAVTNYTSTIVSVYLNTTTPGASTPTFTARTDYTVGNQPFSVAFADINLDGKQDLVTASEGASGVSVLLNTVVFALPVELASFTSSVNGNNVMLNWNTVSEENNSGFDIERNSFGTGWTKIGFAAGKGTVNTQQNYSFSDNGLNSGRYSYRIKQIDYNGNYKYYDLQNEVIVGVPNKFALSQNYPNPFNPTTIINYQLAVNGFVSIKIFDLSGREVSQLVNEVQQAGYYAVNFNAAGLSSGTYFYKISADGFADVKKMVVVK